MHETKAEALLDRLIADGSGPSFDMVFVDVGDRAAYAGLHEQLMKLVRVGGVIVYYDTLWVAELAAACGRGGTLVTPPPPSSSGGRPCPQPRAIPDDARLQRAAASRDPLADASRDPAERLAEAGRALPDDASHARASPVARGSRPARSLCCLLCWTPQRRVSLPGEARRRPARARLARPSLVRHHPLRQDPRGLSLWPPLAATRHLPLPTDGCSLA